MVPASSLPNGTNGLQYQIAYNQTSGRSTYYRYYYSTNETDFIIVTLNNLLRDTEYSIQVAVQYNYQPHCYTYSYGPLSDPVFFKTNETGEYPMMK